MQDSHSLFHKLIELIPIKYDSNIKLINYIDSKYNRIAKKSDSSTDSKIKTDSLKIKTPLYLREGFLHLNI